MEEVAEVARKQALDAGCTTAEAIVEAAAAAPQWWLQAGRLVHALPWRRRESAGSRRSARRAARAAAAARYAWVSKPGLGATTDV